MSGPLFGNRAEPTASFRLYGFEKTALVRIFASPCAAVCDLYCTAGAGTRKWFDAQIGHYIGIDDYSAGVNEAREAWESQNNPCAVEFFDVDPCSEENLDSYLQDRGIPVDIACCLQHLQKRELAEFFVMSRLCSSLGGCFIGIDPRLLHYLVCFRVMDQILQILEESRSFDLLGLYTTIIFQKPDPDLIPPVLTPALPDANDRELSSSRASNRLSTEEEKSQHLRMVGVDQS